MNSGGGQSTLAPPCIPAATPARRFPHLVWWMLGVGAVFLALVLYFYSPAEHSFYPRCAFHSLTGWLCPGCGGLRASHELLHGHFAAAFRLNPLAMLGLPVIAAAIAGSVLKPASRWPRLCLYAAFVSSIAFGILRNLL